MPIPHIIHYCWLSDEPLHSFAAHCLRQWQKILPDYEFRRWDKQSFDITSVAWVHEAYLCKKYAFAADYIRFYALYHFGGLYLDLDILLRADPSPLLTSGFVSFVECYYSADNQRISGCSIQAAAVAAEPHHFFVKKVLEYYENKHFSLDLLNNNEQVAPVILQHLAEEYGFRQADEEQHFGSDITIYPSHLCSPNSRQATPAAIAIHYTDHSWQDKGPLSTLAKRLRRLARVWRLRFNALMR